jgi:hypothetical protein
MRIVHVGLEIAQGLNAEGASRVINNRLIVRTEVLDIGKQRTLKPDYFISYCGNTNSILEGKVTGACRGRDRARRTCGLL